MNDKFAKIPYFSQNPVAAAVATKLTPGRSMRGRYKASDIESIIPSLSSAMSISQSTTQSMNDIDNIFEVLPDVELGMQILVSSILSPNDMRRPELSWSAPDTELPGPLVNALIEVVRDYFENDYKIKTELPKWLENALFTTGSYPIAIVPESSLDDLINRHSISKESLTEHLDPHAVCKSLGILGNPGRATAKHTLGLESLLRPNAVNPDAYKSSFAADKLVHVTDNFGALKMPQAAAKLVDAAIEARIRVATESQALGRIVKDGDKLTLADVENTLYVNRPSHGANNVVELKSGDTASRESIGHPLALKLPSDSVIPVHVPGDVEKHIGYFILLDAFGNPLSNAKQSSYYKEIASMKESLRAGASSSILQQTKLLQKGFNCPENAGFTEMAEIYGKALERDLLDRLRNGIYGENVDIAHVNEIYQVMLARSLSNMRTQMLYVPSSLMLYVAFDYNKLGVGRSLLEKSKTLASIRAILLFANTMAAMKNSTNQRKVKIELDPDDPEPDRTVEILLTELAKVQSQQMLLGTTNPIDITTGIRNAATNIVISGNPLMPEVTMDVEDVAGQRVMVDNDFDESIKNRHLSSLWLTPELVDSATDIEFAAELKNRNLMFSKRTALAQEITESFVAEFVRKFSKASGKLKSDMIKVIRDYFEAKDGSTDETGGMIDEAKTKEIARTRLKDLAKSYTVSEMVDEFINAIKVSLPKPDDTKLTNQMQLLDGYTDALDKVIPHYINEDALEVLMGDDAQQYVKPVIEMVKGYFVRDFLAKNNILPELQKLISPGTIEEEPLDILGSHMDHANSLAVVIANVLDKLKKKNADEPGLSADDGDSGDTYSSSYGDTPEEDTDTSGSEFGADMEFDDEPNVEPEEDDTAAEEQPAAEEETPNEQPASDEAGDTKE